MLGYRIKTDFDSISWESKNTYLDRFEKDLIGRGARFDFFTEKKGEGFVEFMSEDQDFVRWGSEQMHDVATCCKYLHWNKPMNRWLCSLA